MKLVMTLLARDEADIIGANIDFHLAHGVDFIIATDNLSVDGTTEILRGYERLGVLHYIYQADDNHAQFRWVTHMARLARTEFGADWIINNDADEFWYPERGSLKDVLAAVPPSFEALAVARVNFPPRPMTEQDFFANTMVFRERQSLNALGQPLPGKMCHRAFADIEVAQGNHGARRRGQPLTAGTVPITILHFPMRSYRQFVNKISKGAPAYERNPDLAGQGTTWRYLYEIHKAVGLESWWRERVLDDPMIERGQADGTLVHDDRLRKFFAGRSFPPGVES